MNVKGLVSSVGVDGVRIIPLDREDVVSAPLSVAVHVGLLEVGETVAAVFFNTSLNDGIIIAKFPEVT